MEYEFQAKLEFPKGCGGGWGGGGGIQTKKPSMAWTEMYPSSGTTHFHYIYQALVV